MNLRRTAEHQRRLWKETLEQHAGTPRAVGSETLAHKELRYDRISQVFGDDEGFSLHDLGAGVGHYYGYLQQHHRNRGIAYSASDVTKEFCDIAVAEHPGVTFLHRDVLAEDPSDAYDYVVLSGVLHQKGEASHAEWVDYMEALVATAFAMSRRGVAFNLMSPHADYYHPDLYYAALSDVQTFVVRRLSRFFRLDHAYPLFEATFCVYRAEQVRAWFPQPEFSRYFGGSR